MIKRSPFGRVLIIMGILLLLGLPLAGALMILLGALLETVAKTRYRIAYREAEEKAIARQKRELVLAFKSLS